MTQLELPDTPPAPHVETPQERFDSYHAEHPEVLDAIITKALELRRAGANRLSIMALYGMVRAELKTQMPNNHMPYYSRLALKECPALEGFFKCSRAAADRGE